MAQGPATVVTAPLRSAPSNGLLRNAPIQEPTDERWINGFSFPPETCGALEKWTPCLSGADKVRTNNRGANDVYTPFVAIGHDTCSAFGFEEADYVARATRQLLAGESAAVESALWDGVSYTDSGAVVHDTGNVKLAAPGATVVTSGTSGPVRALASLEQALANAGCYSGMIHARPSVVTYWLANHAILDRNGKLYTVSGNVVVPGTGYSGAAPDGTAALLGDEWAYATEMIGVIRSAPVVTPGTFSEAFDRAANTVTYYAERAEGILWSQCCWFAAEVDTTA